MKLSWDADQIVDWLLDEGRLLPDLEELVLQLGQTMQLAGAPIWRLRLSMRTLHPLVTAVTAMWEKESDVAASIETAHGFESQSSYVGSPMEEMNRTGRAFRRRLAGPLSDKDHTVLHELKARGATDYYGFLLPFSDGAAAILVFNTDEDDGFGDQDLAKFDHIGSVLAPIAEVLRLKRIPQAVAEAYLGPRTGRRVLEGQITRGHIESIEAAILVSDIRGWTELNNRVPAEDALAMANRYFEIVSDAVESYGGEILKLLGDGILAVFPTEGEAPDVDTTCDRALASSRKALEIASDLDPPLKLRFGSGLHFGNVLYGNIGSNSRIDFTVLGNAVNMAARIEGQCSQFGKNVLFSEVFANRLTEPSELVGVVLLKGHEVESALYTLSTR